MKISKFKAASSTLLLSAAAFFLLGAGVTVADVALRSVLGQSVPAAIEATSFAIGFGALLSMPACYLNRTHVTARLLSELAPLSFARPLGRIGAVFTLIFAAMLIWMVGENALEKWGSAETSRDLGLPMPILLSIVSAALLAALAAAIVGLWLELKREDG